MSEQRQLTAIMFTDIQGYTAMMQHDEDLTIKIRDRHRKVFTNATEKYHGTILQYFGDGTLSTFKSAIEAVKCAMEMQKEYQKQPVIPVRIGIHLGDVVIREDDIIGDGVNVASRIESLAVAGSVFISDKVYDEIKNQSSIEAQSLKTFELKNVDKPIEVFAISNKGLIMPNITEISGKTKDTKIVDEKKSDKEQPIVHNIKVRRIQYAIIALLVLIAGYFIYQNSSKSGSKAGDLGKSIAVLPFENMTNDPEQEYFSDGITEDIIAHLSKIADLRVISRTSTRQYKNTKKTIPQIGKELGVSTILEGSVRKYGDQVRITAQLINAKTDVHIWAETYDREVEKIFDIQTEVAKEILRVLQATLTPGEVKNLEKSVTSEITAYDYYLRGKEALDNGDTQKEFQYAAQLFQQAIDADPGFAAAYVGLAWTLTTTRNYGSGVEVWRDSAQTLNKIALSMDPELDEAHYLQSEFYVWDKDWEKAIRGFEKVLKLNPNHEGAMYELGEILFVQGEVEKGLELIIDAIMLALNRKEPDLYFGLGNAYMEIGELEKAKIYVKQALKLEPDFSRAFYFLVEICFLQKKYEEARTYAQKNVEIERNVFSLDRLAWTHMLVGDYRNAELVWRELSAIQADFKDQYFAVAFEHRLAYVLWQTGQKEEASKLFDKSIHRNIQIIENKIDTDVLGEAYDLAGIHAFLGHEEEALKWLKKSEEIGFLPISLIERDPLFDKIRKNEQFQSIIVRRKRVEESEKSRFEIIRKKLREMEEQGILNL